MLKFQVFKDEQPATDFPLRNAYLLGADGNAMRGDIVCDKGVIFCQKRETGVCALALQIPTGDCGTLTLQTCLLPEREEPYLLSLELARHRLMTLYNKSEDWGMLDVKSEHPVAKRMDKARSCFIEALCLRKDHPGKADTLAMQSLTASIDGSEELAIAHADLLLNRRRTTGSVPRHVVGTGVALDNTHQHLRDAIYTHFDYVTIPMPWKVLAPEEGDYQWEVLDEWVNWARSREMPVIAGPLVSFEPANLPDWLFIWEHDYETVRDLVYEHIEKVVDHFKDRISSWNVVSGLHVNNHFTVAFDQLMDLTRLSAMAVKKIQPNARVLIEIREPFGEYYAGNQRSIPPMMYADLLIQGGINFDAFTLKMLMGQSVNGQHTRDLMQISNLLDHFAPMGRPINLVMGVPSSMVTEEMIVITDTAQQIDPDCGYWRKPWTPGVQSTWLDAMMHIALSKPFVETITWTTVIDHSQMDLPLSGLVQESMHPKPALKRLTTFRRNLANVRTENASAGSAN